MVIINIPPNYPFAARAVPQFGQVLPRTFPGIGLHIVVLQKYPEIWVALLRVDLIGIIVTEGN